MGENAMSATLLIGKEIAKDIRARLEEEIQSFGTQKLKKNSTCRDTLVGRD